MAIRAVWNRRIPVGITQQYYLVRGNRSTCCNRSLVTMNILLLVGMTGLEPAASCSQSKHSTKLSYIPTYLSMLLLLDIYI